MSSKAILKIASSLNRKMQTLSHPLKEQPPLRAHPWISGNSRRELLLLLEAGSDGVLNHDVRMGFLGLVQQMGKTLEADDTLKPEDAVKSSVEREADQGGSH
ncbi:hypothetical protein GBA52_025291 [Prunus armeniaca]|nr:hypothetical protein GBA52_025291 [Prunus armeniaca]